MTAKVVQEIQSKMESGAQRSMSSVLDHEITVLSILRQLLQSVSYLHRHGIVHRDIRLETV